MGNTLALRGTVGSRNLFTVLAVAVLSLFMVFAGSGNAAYAEDTNQALQTLSQEVAVSVSGNEYAVEGGGSIKGSQLFTKNDGGVYSINQTEFKKLNADGRKNFADDVVASSENSVAKGEKTGVTDETRSNWFRELQSTPGFGTKVLQEALKETSPDMVAGEKLYSPLAPIVSAAMGVLTIALFAFFTLSLVMDLAFIAVPMFRIVVGDGEGGNGNGGAKAIGKIISNTARRAVQEEESGDGKKSALGYYFGKSIAKMVVLGLCLVYLINGQAWVAVGTLLDLLRGFLGF